MSLYLCVFDDEKEMAGVEAGGYGDFNALRGHVCRRLEDGRVGSRFPTLMLHSDCEGEWPPESCVRLRQEIARILAELGPEDTAFFADAEGDPLLFRIDALARCAIEAGRPILFQ